MSAFDNLSIQYFYMGDLQKAKYYNDRMARGKSEAPFSIVRRVSDAQTAKRFRKFK